jgi:hypothetical protein
MGRIEFEYRNAQRHITNAHSIKPWLVEPKRWESLLMCRFSDAGSDESSTRSGGRRLKSAEARNRGKWGTVGAAGSMGI